MDKLHKNGLGKQDHGASGLAATISKPLIAWIRHNTLFLGIASLIWLVFKTGRKPTRIQYPCQKAAAVNVGLFLLPVFASLLHQTYRYLKSSSVQQAVRFVAALCVSIGLIFAANNLWSWHQQNQQAAYYKQLRSRGPIGKKIAGATGAAAGYLTIPHAMALPSPNRVVSVHHAGATSWVLTCKDQPGCDDYYGSDAHVDQAVVDQMVDRGMQTLTDTQTNEAAWEVILPDYQAGEIVAIKVNFNDTIVGGGGGYADSDDYVDALPQIVNSIIAGLKGRGVAEADIRIFDASRHITDRFRALIDYPGVRYFDHYGGRADVDVATFDSTDPDAEVDFSLSEYPAVSSTHKITDVLVEADYLINIPIMKKHGIAGITLTLKNHFGTIDGLLTGQHNIHDYIDPDEEDIYEADRNPIVDINLNTHIKDKTVLIIGDALYGGFSSNNTPPEQWRSFGDDSPNMLFFAADPVAVDSVMLDYLDREGWVHPASVDILVLAADLTLGVHDSWRSDTDRTYEGIDYIEIDLQDETPPTIPADLTAVAISASQIDLNWSAASDPGGSMGGYRIYRDGTLIDSTTEPSYSDTGLLPSTEYTYTVRAYDAASNESGLSDPTTATTAADEIAPDSPTDLTATPVSTTQISLSWTAADDNVGVTEYRIYRDGVFNTAVETTDYTDDGLTAATEYTFSVTALDASGNESDLSDTATAATLAEDPPGQKNNGSSGSSGGCFIGASH